MTIYLVGGISANLNPLWKAAWNAKIGGGA